MKETLLLLVELQKLTRQRESEAGEANLAKRIDRLRSNIPEKHLVRFDQLLEHQRNAVASLSQSGACGSCHMRLPVGDVLLIRRSSDRIHICQFCGCFLHTLPASQ